MRHSTFTRKSMALAISLCLVPSLWADLSSLALAAPLEEVGDATMRVTLFGENLTDDDYPVYSINFVALGLITEQYGGPRTWVIELAYEY